MADNLTLPASGSPKAATDEVTHSGDTAHLQIFRPAHVTGSEGSKTVVALTDANGVMQQGGIAHDAADAGSPVKIGFKAIAMGASPTPVAAADRSDAYCNRHGVPFQIGGHPNTLTLRANYTGAETNTAIITVAGGEKIVVTQIQVTASNANTASPSVIIGFAAATTPTTTSVVASHPGVPGGGGFSRGDGSGVLGVGADGEDLRITSGAPTGGSIDVVVSYHTVPS